jgi:lambda family phage minor tail protein L
VTNPTVDMQSPDVGDVVELYEIDCSAIFGQILRFSSSPLIVNRQTPVPAPVLWRGETYVPRACESSGWQWDGSGPIPQPKLTVGNTDKAISALCIAYNDLQGAIVTRHRVPLKYLDGMPDEDPGIEYDPDIFAIDQKVAQNKIAVDFTLGAAIDVVGRLIPGRQVLQAYCPFRYRTWNGVAFVYNQGSAACPYTDNRYYDINGNQVGDPAKDRPSKRLQSCCKKRFPTGDLPFGGFPGAAKYRG